MEKILLIPKIKYIYPIFILLSFFIPFLIIYLKNLKIKRYSKRFILYSFLCSFLCAIYGGFVVTIISSLITKHKIEFGLSSYGGAIGLILSIWVYKKIVKKTHPSINTKPLSAEYITHIPLMYSISKLACGFNGCCVGIEYSGPLAVTYDGATSYLPFQFIETIIFLLIYLFTIKKFNNIYFIILLSGISKFVFEFFRYGYTGLNINQIISLVFVVFAITRLFNASRNSICTKETSAV